jgi:hypothetical protein
MRSLVVVQGQAQLLQVVLTPRAPGRFARRLHRGQEQRYQDADDGNDHKKFDQGKTAPKTFASCFHRFLSRRRMRNPQLNTISY